MRNLSRHAAAQKPPLEGVVLDHEPNQPIFKHVFGSTWEAMPPILKSRYGNRAFCDDFVKVQGLLTIVFSKYITIMSPILRLFGALVPYQGRDIPVTVEFQSKKYSNNISMNRTFDYPNKKPYHFNSTLEISKNEVIEFVRFGLGIRQQVTYENNKVILKSLGYVWRIGNMTIPLPLGLFMGDIYSEEEAVSANSFKTVLRITHPILGKIFEYQGVFQMVINNPDSVLKIK